MLACQSRWAALDQPPPRIVAQARDGIPVGYHDRATIDAPVRPVGHPHSIPIAPIVYTPRMAGAAIRNVAIPPPRMLRPLLDVPGASAMLLGALRSVGASAATFSADDVALALAAMTAAALVVGTTAALALAVAATLVVGTTAALALAVAAALAAALSATATLREDRRSQSCRSRDEGEKHRTHGMISLIMRTNGAPTAKFRRAGEQDGCWLAL